MGKEQLSVCYALVGSQIQMQTKWLNIVSEKHQI